MIKFCSRKAAKYVTRFLVVLSRYILTLKSEPNDGKFTAFRLGRQFTVVHAYEYHLVSQQG